MELPPLAREDPTSALIRWSSMIQAGPVGFFAVSPSGRITFANAAASQMSGLKIGDWAWASIQPQDRRPLFQQIKERFAADRAVSVDTTIVNRRAQVQTAAQLHLFPSPEAAQGAHVGLILDVTRRNMREENLRYKAQHDMLTGLMNRGACMSELQRRLRDRRRSEAVAVLFFDLDKFKDINDAFGHEAGDELLRVVASRLTAAVREDDAVGRLGGDEFVVISTAGNAGDDALALAHRLEASISEPFIFGESTIQPAVSIGVALQRSGETDPERLVSDADLAMYEAKAGRPTTGPVVLASENSRSGLQRRLRISTDFETAWENGDIGFVYQPIRESDSGMLMACECFVRWNHPELGQIPPVEFLKYAETSSSLGRFTQWSLDTVTAELAGLRSRFPLFADKQISMNVSPRQLSVDSYVEMHLEALRRNGLQTEDIILEVQEWTPNASERLSVSLSALTEAEIPIVLDYFGVGYNALEYVQLLPVIGFKIAPSLTRSLVTSGPSRAIVRGLLVTANELGLDTLAEGIESWDQLAISRELGMSFVQGHALGLPAPIAEFEATERLLEGRAIGEVLEHFAALTAV